MNEDDVLDPLKGLQRAEPGPFLFTRIEARLRTQANARIVFRVSPTTVRLTVAGLALLALLNVLAWRQAPEPANSEPVAAYRLETASYQLY